MLGSPREPPPRQEEIVIATDPIEQRVGVRGPRRPRAAPRDGRDRPAVRRQPPPSAPSTASPWRQSANTIIVGSKKEPKRYCACVVRATRRLDVNHTVRKLLGVSRLSFADPEETRALTGMMLGGVTVFALPPDLPIYVDEGLMALAWIILGGQPLPRAKITPPSSAPCPAPPWSRVCHRGRRGMTPDAEGPRDATPGTRARQTCRARRAAVRRRAGLRGRRARLHRPRCPRSTFRNDRGPRRLQPEATTPSSRHEQAPATVNPSLWRQARLNMNNGLFQVTDRIYQVRGFDISNMTIIEGEPRPHRHRSADLHRGRARGAGALPRAPRRQAGDRGDLHPQPRRPLRRRARRGRRGRRGGRQRRGHRARQASWRRSSARTCWPATPMIRRAQFQFGATLPKGPRGQVDAGLGKVTSRGTVTPDPADRWRSASRSRCTGSTASRSSSSSRPTPRRRPRCTCSIPACGALNLAENATHNLHNIYPDPRRAGARRQRAGPSTSTRRAIVRGQGRGGVRPASLAGVGQRAAMLDYLGQAARHLQVPPRPDAAAHEPRLQGRRRSPSGSTLPPELQTEWHVRGYYGTLSHNAKAVYQRYLGWYDANPANLNPLPPVERRRGSTSSTWAARRRCIARAREDFARGEYRWVAEAMSQVVFAEPGNAEARALGADALEQLGYQAEVGDLAQRLPARRARAAAAARRPSARACRAGPDIVRGHDPRPVLRLPRRAPERPRRPRARRIVINWAFPDTDQRYVLTLQNCALTYLAEPPERAAPTRP